MTTHKKKSHHKATPAEKMRDMADAKQAQSRQTPSWPGAHEQAQPRHANVQPVNDAAPREAQPSTSEAIHERNDINKRHH